MGIKNRITDGYKYYLTLTVVYWVDVFTRPRYRHIIIESLQHAQNYKGLMIYAWCLMSNHLHLIVEAKEGHKLPDILRDFKKHTSKKIIGSIKEYPESRRDWLLDRFEFAGRFDKKIKEYKFWMNGNEAKEIITTEFMKEKLNYLHQNPVKAEYVDRAEDYKFSSARSYCNPNAGLIEIIKIE